MKRIYIKFCIIQTKRIQHNIINRITFIKIIHPRKPAISLSYPYRFNNLLTPSSPTLFKTILPQTSPQTFHLIDFTRLRESSKDFFYDPILNNTRSPSNIRETKKDSPFPFPFFPSPLTFLDRLAFLQNEEAAKRTGGIDYPGMHSETSAIF